MKTFGHLLKTRKHLSIREVDGYEQRLKNGEKKRDLEKNEVRKSLQMLGFDSVVGYKENGQPYLEKFPDLFVSISHSKGWFAVCVSEQPVGIDIEQENPRILEGASYFVNDREQHFTNDLRALHLVWGAKEAFYKLKEGKIGDLKNEVTLLSIEEDKTLKLEFETTVYDFDFEQDNGITVVVN